MAEGDGAAIAEISKLLNAAPIGLATSFTVTSGKRWWAVDQLGDTGQIESWIDEIVERDDGDRSPADAAAIVTVGRLAHAVVARPAIVFAVQSRALLGGRSLTVQRDPSGSFEAVAFRPRPVMVRPTDPLAGTPGTVVAGTASMMASLAADWVAVLGPIVDAARVRGRVGRRGLWGRVIDTIGGSVLWAVQALGWEEDRQLAAWRSAAHLCDAVDTRLPSRVGRPRLIRQATELVSVPSACCLLHKVARSRLPDGTREHCDVCPLLPAVAVVPSVPLAG